MRITVTRSVVRAEAARKLEREVARRRRELSERQPLLPRLRTLIRRGSAEPELEPERRLAGEVPEL